MANPEGWPPKQSPGTRPLRFFVTGTTTAAFDGNAYLFGTDPVTGDINQAANVTPLPVMQPGYTSTNPVTIPRMPVGGGRNGLEVPVPMRYAGTIQITNDSAVAGDTIEFSFDGTNVHGEVKNGETRVYRQRQEAGICLRTKTASGNCAFRLEAW